MADERARRPVFGPANTYQLFRESAAIWATIEAAMVLEAME
jgi:hypothetical protein